MITKHDQLTRRYFEHRKRGTLAHIAIDYARAEIEARERDWWIDWIADAESFTIDDVCDYHCKKRGYHDEEQCKVYCEGAGAWINACHREHEVYGAILRDCDEIDRDHTHDRACHLQSLWCIVDPYLDQDSAYYRRTIVDDLICQELSEIDHAERADRDALASLKGYAER